MLGLPSCKQVSEQCSYQLDEDLPMLKRARLKLHLAICEQCRRYVKQMKLTDASVRYWVRGRRMPSEVKQQLLTQFQEMNNPDTGKKDDSQ
ncbi:zf-HC2 domain-containing protein [Pleionea sediminis]|uniref:anti-sigma factor family protein n=1 Tax=Pleionea sediminis TaxID=2569479 RepID=UPI001184EBAD|nr:zf-HC2 domain-containing protein [Pleionea sediminis]